jgi:L-rhamnose mutarotase
MQRVAFQLRIREGCEQAYDDAHRRVWPELIAELRAAGVSEYSIFRRNQELVLYMKVSSFDSFLTYVDNSDVDKRWQQNMANLFVQVPSLRLGERFAMMEEVFHMRPIVT